MVTLKSWLLLVLIFTFTSAQDIADPQLLEDPELVALLNNYFGCKTWQDGVCTECSERYYFNKNGVCCEVKPQCKTFNVAEGICEGCYQGWDIVDGKCVPVDLVNSDQKGCKAWEDGKCIECSKRWFFNADGICQEVSDLCRTWADDGKCESCYKGYVVNGGICEKDPNAFDGSNNPLCADWNWDDRQCLKCAERAYFNQDGICSAVSDHCQTWDAFDGTCLTCYEGYDLTDGECVWSPDNEKGPDDLGCKTWDWQNRICLQCSARWVQTDSGCVPVSDHCAAHDDKGACTECYKGYVLKDGECVWDEFNDQGPSDLGCKTWDWDNQVCLECSERWVQTDSGCVPVSDHCAAHDDKGACTECYKGYVLKDGECVWDEFNDQGPSDLGCKTWDWDNQVCLECSERWVMTDSGCVPVSDHCAAHDDKGACTDCYKGYVLKDGECVWDEFNDQGPSDLGCKTWDWDNQVCLECSERWVMSDSGCIPVDDHCNSHDDKGACTSCYKGYLLKDGLCELANPICKSVDESGNCTSCYSGFVLYKNNCTPLSKLADIALYYQECCPQKLEQLKTEGRA